MYVGHFVAESLNSPRKRYGNIKCGKENVIAGFLLAWNWDK
jgi:hypothetical protein